MNSPVNTKRELIQKIIDDRLQISSYGVKSLGIFGSFVRNEAKESSDIDFLIEFYPEKKNFDNFMDLAFFSSKSTWKKSRDCHTSVIK